ncbi:MAG: hypothetical protein KGK44_09650 [Gammaproteobacteria bacterium]|nr:hypothetical protein [Gammaproteobacteria bacterium]
MARAAVRRFLSATFVACVLLLAACATAYQPADADGAGFADQPVSKDEYAVAFVGNTHTSQEKLHDYALLYAAQITTSHAQRYFMVTGQRSVSFLQPPKYCGKPRLATYFVNPEGGYSPVYSHQGNSATRFNAIEIEIRLLAAMPAVPGNSTYDAHEVMRVMDKRYGLNITPDSGIAKPTTSSDSGRECN